MRERITSHLTGSFSCINAKLISNLMYSNPMAMVARYLFICNLCVVGTLHMNVYIATLGKT